MRFDAEIGDLRRSAAAARSVADQAATLDPDGALSGAANGMPGAQAGAVIARVAARWAAERTSWLARARGYAGDLEAAASTYAASDAAGREAFLSARQRPQ